MTDWQEIEKKVLMQTIKRSPVTLTRGSGMRVWDIEGKEYLDFVGGWAVNSLGHCHPVVVKSLTKQAKALIHVSNQFYTTPQIQLAKLLVDVSCFDRVFFCNSGAEANEGAIKLARKYGKLQLGGAYEIITMLGSFHGRTLAMVAATGQTKFQEPYTPLPAGFVNVEYNNVDAVKRATGKLTCAVMVEPVQGEGGVNIPDGAYLKAIRSWCDEKGILLIVDEVQTGLGRTGTLFAYEQFGAEPDIMTLAKGLGSGVPIGAVLAKERVSIFTPGDHGSTFGGNPLVCAVSLSVLQFIIENGITKQAKKMGQYLLQEMEQLKTKYNFIKDVRGLGLLVAMSFTSDIAEDIVLACLTRGLLINKVKPDTLRFMPPIIVSRNDIDEALAVLEEVLKGGY